MRPDIDRLFSAGDYQRSFDWGVYFLIPPQSLKDFNYNSPNKGILWYCKEVRGLKLKNTTTTIKIHGFTIKQPGRTDYSGELTLTFVEPQEQKNGIRAFAYAWLETQSKSENELMVRGYKSGVKMSVYQYNRVGEATAKYNIEGCVLTDVDFGRFDSNNELSEITMKVSYSRLTMGDV